MSTNSRAPEKRSIELLSPARDVPTAIEAILHGADAVYIGAPKFGARLEAGNSLQELSELIPFAHFYGARVYVTLNTILYDSEVEEARAMAVQLRDMGVDALLVQDAALLPDGTMPPMPLHASTQTDNRTPEKVKRLWEEGFSTVVLARELGIDEIRRIHEACPEMRLEAFVHGALCVSLSGRCYASQHCFSRSANRGECAQFCRLPFDLQTENGKTLLRGKHLLSLRDLNRTASIEQLMDAGISSFKIEGRLKDTAYVKNITAWYRRKIDTILARRPEYVRSSFGESRCNFDAKPEKSFNRGFTEYFFPSAHMANLSSPKSIGEYAGEVRTIGRRSILVSGHMSFAAGDGLCYYTPEGELAGFRVNSVLGMELFPYKMPASLKPHTRLYRNHDAAFSAVLSSSSAERAIKLNMDLTYSGGEYTLSGRDEAGREAEAKIEFPHQEARTPQRDNITAQLSRLGGSGYRAGTVKLPEAPGFIPSSKLAEARRSLVAALKAIPFPPPLPARKPGSVSFSGTLDYSFNVANKAAEAYYLEHGATAVEPAWEKREPANAPIMTCRYCIRRELSICLKEKDSPREPLFLRLKDGRRFSLDFDCRHCIMKVYASK